jgi:hypothetical protein
MEHFQPISQCAVCFSIGPVNFELVRATAVIVSSRSCNSEHQQIVSDNVTFLFLALASSYYWMRIFPSE